MQLVAGLSDEPYCLSADDISKLTMRQIVTIYYRKRDKHGVPRKIDAHWYEGDEVDTRGAYKQFMEMGLAFGRSPEELQKQWEEATGGESSGQSK